MPIYEYTCKCGAEREVTLPFSEAGKQLRCDCGEIMCRKFSLVNFSVKVSGRENVLKTLNKEGGYTFPGGDMHRKRYEKALAKGLESHSQPGRYKSGVGIAAELD